MIQWNHEENHLVLNPRWPEEVRRQLQAAAKSWWSEGNRKGLILVPTSGTTAKDLSSVKIVVQSKQSFLNSARIVGERFGFSSEDRVLQSLPLFHVGGLSQGARAFYWKQTLVEGLTTWKPQDFYEFLKKEKISHVSLVPTQLYDLIQLNLKSPETLRCVFIGGGRLGPKLRENAKELGWPVHSTYGMTETASMMAWGDSTEFMPFPSFEIRISSDSYLEVKSPTLFEGYFLLTSNGAEFWDPKTKGFFKTDDLAVVAENGFQLIGRPSDYAKVSGEGVYLSRLQIILQDLLVELGLPLNEFFLSFQESERLGHVVTAQSIWTANKARPVIDRFNEKVLPFERIQEFHQVSEIPTTELGKIRLREVR